MSLPKAAAGSGDPMGSAFAAENGVAIQANIRQATAMSFAVFMMSVLGMVEALPGLVLPLLPGSNGSEPSSAHNEAYGRKTAQP
ncbi:hypothetical protein GCM10023063_33510 [Arthrobacter methylotrophus]